MNHDPVTASTLLQKSLNNLSPWLKRWRIKVNSSKCAHVTFTNRRDNCPPVALDGEAIPTKNVFKYLGIDLDRSLVWKSHIFSKRKQLRKLSGINNHEIDHLQDHHQTSLDIWNTALL